MNARVVVFDWGIGGLPTFERLRASGLTPIYVSDAGAPPYGTLAVDVLARRIETVLASLPCRPSPLVLACNAASTATPHLRLSETHVLNILQEGIRVASERTRPGDTVGIVGGQRTIDSERIQAALLKTGRLVNARVAQSLSAHVEAGRLSGPAVERDIKKAVDGLQDVDVLLLACTHYPALTPLFERHLPGVDILDPSARFASTVSRFVRHRHRHRQPDHAPRWFTTGDKAQMIGAARRVFEVELPHVETLRV